MAKFKNKHIVDIPHIPGRSTNAPPHHAPPLVLQHYQNTSTAWMIFDDVLRWGQSTATNRLRTLQCQQGTHRSPGGRCCRTPCQHCFPLTCSLRGTPGRCLPPSRTSAASQHPVQQQ
jgi:hypothetical protein